MMRSWPFFVVPGFRSCYAGACLYQDIEPVRKEYDVDATSQQMFGTFAEPLINTGTGWHLQGQPFDGSIDYGTQSGMVHSAVPDQWGINLWQIGGAMSVYFPVGDRTVWVFTILTEWYTHFYGGFMSVLTFLEVTEREWDAAELFHRYSAAQSAHDIVIFSRDDAQLEDADCDFCDDAHTSDRGQCQQVYDSGPSTCAPRCRVAASAALQQCQEAFAASRYSEAEAHKLCVSEALHAATVCVAQCTRSVSRCYRIANLEYRVCRAECLRDTASVPVPVPAPMLLEAPDDQDAFSALNVADAAQFDEETPPATENASRPRTAFQAQPASLSNNDSHLGAKHSGKPGAQPRHVTLKLRSEEHVGVQVANQSAARSHLKLRAATSCQLKACATELPTSVLTGSQPNGDSCEIHDECLPGIDIIVGNNLFATDYVVCVDSCPFSSSDAEAGWVGIRRWVAPVVFHRGPGCDGG